MIVEDAATCAAALEMVFFAIPDMAVVVLPAAQDALRLLERADCAVRAVITDLNMPRMDGFEFIERIRAQREGRQLRIGQGVVERGSFPRHCQGGYRPLVPARARPS